MLNFKCGWSVWILLGGAEDGSIFDRDWQVKSANFQVHFLQSWTYSKSAIDCVTVCADMQSLPEHTKRHAGLVSESLGEKCVTKTFAVSKITHSFPIQ